MRVDEAVMKGVCSRFRGLSGCFRSQAEPSQRCGQLYGLAAKICFCMI